MEFEVLKDLVRVITRNKVKQIEVLGNPAEEESRLEEFYNLLSNGAFETEEDAARHFFDTDNTKDRAYRKLRNRLIRQLINTSFFVDVNQAKYDDRTKAEFSCYHDFAAANVLMRSEARLAGVYLLHQVLEQAEKYEFVDLATEITRTLRSMYARSATDPKNHSKFTELHRAYEEKRSLIVQILDAYETLLDYYIQKHSPDEEVHNLASEYVDQFKPRIQEVNITIYTYYSYVIELIKHFAANDCATVVSVSEEALDALKQYSNARDGQLFGIAVQKLGALIQLKKDLPEIQETVDLCFSFTTEGVFNWFVTQFNLIYALMYNREYQKALEVFKEGYLHERFAVLPDRTQEEWKLLGYYFHLLAALDQVPHEAVDELMGPFKLSKFENDFTLLNKDKEGMNIPILVLSAVYALAQSDFELFEERFEKMDKYRKRYLENELNQRSARFFQMLFALSKKWFTGSTRSEGRIRKEMEKLIALTPQVARQSFAIEIIPYEDLWELLIEKNE